MKTTKIILAIIIISTIIMMFPTEVFAWLPYSTYDACNKINIYISLILIIVAIITFITYISVSIVYMIHSKKEKNQKNKNVVKWLIITIIQIAVLLIGALGVRKIGMELYWYPSGERYRFNEIDDYISNGIRIAALVLIIAYIITAIMYFFKSKQETDKKIINLAKWQMMTIVIVAGLLTLATNW